MRTNHPKLYLYSRQNPTTARATPMDALTRDRNKVLSETVAQTVYKYLEDVENDRPKYANRWIWELLQNARDAAKDSPATVEAAITNKLTKDSDITSEDVLAGARFVPTIGQELQGLWQELTNFETLTAAVPKTDGDIELEIQDAEVRFKIGKELWEQGMTFTAAIPFFRRTPR
jgi:hypothetical protein